MCVCVHPCPPPPSSDYEKVIAHYIQQHRFEEALKNLTEKASEALQAPEGVCYEWRGWSIMVLPW